jgi:DHA1 family multidrug resistance protein-like MFS transporter
VRLALRDRPFVKFNLLLMGYWFMSSQLSISFPLVATAIAGTSSAVSWVFGLNAGMIVVLQYPVMRLAGPRLRPQMALILGMTIMAAGLVGIGFAAQVPMLLGAVAVYSFGQLLASPSQQTVTASFANPVAVGSYFGVAALSLAFGGSLGNLSGGFLYGFGEQLDAPAVPWLVFATVGTVAAVGLVLLDRRLGVRRERTVASVVPAGR